MQAVAASGDSLAQAESLQSTHPQAFTAQALIRLRSLNPVRSTRSTAFVD
ncbi:MAG: hypothetical protein HY785_19550 [Oscillatoriophycideae cyanobacterium NC_groundwater_1537_Pr4_S-0.65um_50_18]|nr:hypothetical protein [Oscillatoriophycideae cyanobacterium NC_groundwater_1537_Pr4_S-0.65um_50_18]